MSREVHVRFCESVGVRLLRATHLVCVFESRKDAEAYLSALRERLAKFGLQLSEKKSGIVRFNRHDPKGSKPFTFLGFDFYWADTRSGRPTVKRRTSKKKFRASLQAVKSWLRENRSKPLQWLGAQVGSKLNSYWNYYGVIANSMSLMRFYKAVRKLCWKWLNRRSQRRSYRTRGFDAMWQSWGIPRPRIVEEPYRSQPDLWTYSHS